MSISIHIPFYNPNPEKKEGYRNLTRFDYLRENILNLKKLSLPTDIFIHTHNNFLNDKELDANIIKHQINNDDLEKGYLTWLTRPEMQKQKDSYNYFMYLEHDIKFTEKNLQYYLKFQKNLSSKKFNLGFLIYEKDNKDNQNYSIHITERLKSFVYIDSQKFFINDRENYCCFWIYDQKQFKDFIGSKWWNFKKKVHNFRHNYGITERSSIGFNALNINYFIATLLPEINKQTDPDCFIEHMTNNYYDKFSELKSQNFKDIRGVCTIKINEVIYENKIKEKKIIILYLEKFLKTLFWKLRFLSRLFKK
ncbi:hypothetical protein OA519_00185 [Candidatus Pelagibacter sp.]|nr:hypothetical protein [Candidatus Pelagibacter sp.]